MAILPDGKPHPTRQDGAADCDEGESRTHSRRGYDAIVVGAGAAGLGVGITLIHAGVENILIVDRHEIGASFLRWPQEMRFITPSFPTNSIGMLDINSIAIGTSPGFSLRKEHPSGREYAAYLRAVAEHFELPVRTGVAVTGVQAAEEGFALQTSAGPMHARFVIWATGEFQYPRLNVFPGARWCQHNSSVNSWSALDGDDFIVIGGYESGIDCAIHLASRGKRVTVLDRQSPWSCDDSDPSRSLSPFTIERLRQAQKHQRIELCGDHDVFEVERRDAGFCVKTATGRDFLASAPPILATGFSGGLNLIDHLILRRQDGYPLVSDCDESTIQPGLFICGPLLRHEDHIFCFIYKFRQRFAVVAKAIATRLGLPGEQLEMYRMWGMYLDDLSCCGEACVC